MANRDRWAADAVAREVLARHRRALVIYGGTHLLRGGGSLVGLLENEGADRICTIWTHVSGALATLQADAATWPTLSLVALRGTPLGAAPFGFYFPPAGRGDARMEDRIDAMLYLGDPSTLTTSRVTPALRSDADYIRIRIQRTNTIGFKFPPWEPYPDWQSAFRAACR